MQVAFFSHFSIFRNGINIYVLLLILFMLTLRFRQLLIWTFAIGLGLDVYSGLGFGLITIALLAAALAAYLLYMNFFSHQANLSLIFLTAVMVVTYNLILSLASVLFYAVGLSRVYVAIDSAWLVGLVYQLLGTGLAFVALYVVFHPTIERFREQFMIRRV
jgi:hypothetical protein